MSVSRRVKRLARKPAGHLGILAGVGKSNDFRLDRVFADYDEFQALFHWHVADLGMEHVYIKPRTPQQAAMLVFWCAWQHGRRGLHGICLWQCSLAG